MGDLEYKRVSKTLSIRGRKVLIQKIKNILRMEEREEVEEKETEKPPWASPSAPKGCDLIIRLWAPMA